MRRIVRLALMASIAAVVALVGSSPASAQPSGGSAPACGDRNGCVRAVIVNGYLDEINVDFIREAVRESQATPGYRAVVLVVNSPGSVVDDDVLERMVDELRASRVPISAWVGPSGAHALGGAAELVAALEYSSMAPRTDIGDVGEPRLTGDDYADLPTATLPGIRNHTLDENEAKKAGLVDRMSPTLGDHVLAIEDMPFKVVKDENGKPKRQLTARAVTESLPITTQLLHTAASPAVAYLALAIAIGLLLFEFFTAGIGIAGVVGAVAAVMAAYGLAELPIRGWALGLCLFSAFAFAIDIQTAIPRAWTIIGLICWSVGSVFLFEGFRPPWLALIAGIGGMAIAMISGMPAMVRSRFATPTLGRDWMIGREGTSLTDIDPEGTAEVDGGQWRALTNRATPLTAGEPLRVVAIDGLTLEVEPLEGGAIDYRERRAAKHETAADS